ncbi:MAG: radical SAM protein [archaeon]
MKIFLGNPPWIVGKRKGVRAGSRWPHLKLKIESDYLPYPFFLGYASSLLKKNGFIVKAVDAVAQDIDYVEFYNLIKEFSPDLIFLETSTPSLEHDLELIKMFKIYSSAKIAVAGPDMNVLNEKFLESNEFIDYALTGEYEFTLLELANSINEQRSLKNIRGLVYRQDDKCIKTENREISNIDDFPWPDRIDLPAYKYNDRPGGIPTPSAQIIASRGCPYLCSFCAWPQLVYGGRNYRTRDIKDVVDEMEMLRGKGFRSIYFDDDTFNIGRKRMLELAAELKSRKWKLSWAFMGRSDLIDEEILSKFKEVGLHAVKYGVESGVQKIVDSSGKGLNLAIATKNMLLTKKMGIKMHLTFTFGLSGETKQTIQKTVDYALMINPDSVQFSIMTPFPGTKFYNELKSKNMLASENLSDYDGNTGSVIRTEKLSPQDLNQAQKQAYEKWHWFKAQQHKNKRMSLPRRFLSCLIDNGPIYTLAHSFNYIKNTKHNIQNNQEPQCDILLINTPPWGVDNPPLTFGYLESLIESKGYSSDFIDLNIIMHNSSKTYQYLWELNNKNYWMTKDSVFNIMSQFENIIDETVGRIISHPAKAIGFSIALGKHFFALELIKRIKRKSDKKIIVGGRYFVEYPPTKEFAEIIDVIISGEAESVIPEILDRIKKNKPLTDLPGTIERKNDMIEYIPAVKKTPSMDNYPYPKYRSFDMSQYKLPVICAEWSRGCIANCVFCAYPMPGINFILRSPENIFEEIKYNYEVNKINHLTLVDASLNSNIMHLERVCDLLINANYDLTWSGMAIPRKEMTYPILKKMRQAGCIRLEYGVESGSDRIIKLMKKLHTVKISEDVLRDTKMAGIKPVIYLMVGFPGETEEEFRLTMDFITRNNENIDYVRGICAPFLSPGTHLANHPEEYNIIFPYGQTDYRWETKDGSTLDIREERARRMFRHLSDNNISSDGTVHTLNEVKSLIFRK